MSCEVHALAKRFGAFRLGVDFEILPGEFASLVGPSGCGKTTVLRLLAGLETADAGSIVVDGIDITDFPPEKRGIGFIFQNYALFPHLNVERNVSYGLDIRRTNRAASAAAVSEMMSSMRLAGYGKRNPTSLSGGERQRVALARALAVGPRLVLFDEPLSATDPSLRRSLLDEIRDYQRRIGFSALYVTHDHAEALSASDRVIVLMAGKIEQVGTPEEVYGNPADRRVAEFFGGGNSIGGILLDADGDRATVETPYGIFEGRLAAPHDRTLSAGDRAEAFFRAEDAVIPEGSSRSGRNTISCRVVDARFEGFRYRMLLGYGEGMLLSIFVLPAGRSGIGTEIGVYVDPSRCLVFPLLP